MGYKTRAITPVIVFGLEAAAKTHTMSIMILQFAKSSSSTVPVEQITPEGMRRREIREQARRELPALRKQSQEGIATLKRLAERAGR